MSKITRLQADNFKKLTAIDIRPGAGVVPIRGRNAQGKSSTLDAIQAALGGKRVMPSRPVRSGEEEGAIRLELDDGTLILRRFTSDGRDSIEVTNGEGFKASSPQKLLDTLYTSVAFDPLAFTRLEPKAQLARLRELVTLDIDVDALEKANAADYERRRDKNRELKTEEARLSQMPEYTNVPAQRVDEEALEQVIANAAETNGLIERRRVNREEFAAAIARNKEIVPISKANIDEAEQRLEEMRAKLRELLDLISTQEQQLANAEPLPDPVDVSQAQTDLREARETNRKIDADKARQTQAALVAVLERESDDLTKAMDARSNQIADAITRAKMPVPGLSFGDGEVLLNGLPLDQASAAEQLRLSTAIGMASAPKLRVMLVRDGSLLDDEGERILSELAAENDFQLWVEAVDTSGKVGIVLEAGEVVSIDGEPAPEPEAIPSPKRRAKKDPRSENEENGEEIAQETQKSAALPPDPQQEEVTPFQPRHSEPVTSLFD